MKAENFLLLSFLLTYCRSFVIYVSSSLLHFPYIGCNNQHPHLISPPPLNIKSWLWYKFLHYSMVLCFRGGVFWCWLWLCWLWDGCIEAEEGEYWIKYATRIETYELWLERWKVRFGSVSFFFLSFVLLPVLNPRSYDGARIFFFLEVSGRPMLVIGRSYFGSVCGSDEVIIPQSVWYIIDVHSFCLRHRNHSFFVDALNFSPTYVPTTTVPPRVHSRYF